MECIFCDIANKTDQSSIVYEDDLVIAIMDIYPIQNGHTLVIPKSHYITLADCPDEIVSRLSVVMKNLNVAVQRATGCEGILNELMNGEAAGQEIFHAHFHIIPRNNNDGFGWRYPKGYREKMADRTELDQTALKISSQISFKK